VLIKREIKAWTKNMEVGKLYKFSPYKNLHVKSTLKWEDKIKMNLRIGSSGRLFQTAYIMFSNHTTHQVSLGSFPDKSVCPMSQRVHQATGITFHRYSYSSEVTRFIYHHYNWSNETR